MGDIAAPRSDLADILEGDHRDERFCDIVLRHRSADAPEANLHRESIARPIGALRSVVRPADASYSQCTGVR
jgi:hypothetical protein